MPVEIAGFAQSFSRCREFENVNPSKLECVLAEVDEPLEMMFIEPCVEPPVIQSGSQFDYLLFVQSGTVVPWTLPRSELRAPFLIGVHEFLALADRWMGDLLRRHGSYRCNDPFGVDEANRQTHSRRSGKHAPEAHATTGAILLDITGNQWQFTLARGGSTGVQAKSERGGPWPGSNDLHKAEGSWSPDNLI